MIAPKIYILIPESNIFIILNAIIKSTIIKYITSCIITLIVDTRLNFLQALKKSNIKESIIPIITNPIKSLIWLNITNLLFK